MPSAPVPAPPPLEIDDLLLRPTPAGDDPHAPSELVVERSGVRVGRVELRLADDRSARLRVEVDLPYRGQGIATRAVRRAVRHGFEDLGLLRMEACAGADDHAAQWVANRAGLRFECVRRGLPEAGGDTWQYAALPGDPEPGTRESFLAQLNARMPRKREIAQVLLTDGGGRVLLCELTYKREWDLPGGVVDPFESARTAAERELREELGLDVPVTRLVAVNWLAPYRQWDDATLFVFAAEVPVDLESRMSLQAREIRAIHWCDAAEAAQHVAPYLAELLPTLLAAREVLYLDQGRPIGQPAQD